jgi:hypothetical protein
MSLIAIPVGIYQTAFGEAMPEVGQPLLFLIALTATYVFGIRWYYRYERSKTDLPRNPKEQAHYDGRMQRIAANQAQLASLRAQDTDAQAAQAAHRTALQQILQAHPLLSNLGYTADPSPSGRLLALT